MALAGGQWKCNTSVGFSIPASVKQFPAAMNQKEIVMRANTKFPLSVYKMRYPFRQDKTRVHGFEFCSLQSVAYVPFVLAAWISYPFDNLLVTFFAIRLVAALLFLVSVYISLKIVSVRFRYFVYLFAATPMVIHQATAVSYDAPLLYGVMVSFAWFTSLMEMKSIPVKALLGFIACILITSLVKQGHFFVYALPLFVLVRMVSFKSTRSRIVAWVCGIATVIVGVYGVQTFIKNNLFRTQIQVYAIDPLYFFRQLYATIGENGDFYLRGMAGIFGWLDTALPAFLFVAYWIVLGILFLKTIRFERKPSRLLTGLFLSVICVVNIVAIFFHFAYSAETPAAYAVIFGMQGRYILPFLPFILYGASLMVSSVGNVKIKYFMLVAGGVLAAGSLVGIFYQRYFNYGTTYKNPRYFEIRLFEKPTIDVKKLLPFTIDRSMTYEVKPLYPNYKTGGFQFVVGNELDVTTPYEFRVSDRNCTRVVRQGFLDKLKNHSLSFLKGPTDIVYTQAFPITEMEGATYCVTLWPVIEDSSRTYLQLLGNEQSPLIEFLYIQQ